MSNMFNRTREELEEYANAILDAREEADRGADDELKELVISNLQEISRSKQASDHYGELLRLFKLGVESHVLEIRRIVHNERSSATVTLQEQLSQSIASPVVTQQGLEETSGGISDQTSELLQRVNYQRTKFHTRADSVGSLDEIRRIIENADLKLESLLMGSPDWGSRNMKQKIKLFEESAKDLASCRAKLFAMKKRLEFLRESPELKMPGSYLEEARRSAQSSRESALHHSLRDSTVL